MFDGFIIVPRFGPVKQKETPGHIEPDVSFYAVVLSRAEICLNGLHPLTLGHMEGTAAVTVAAADAVTGPLFQRQIVLPGQLVPLHGQIVVFVDEGNVQPGGTGMTVLAVDAAPHRTSAGVWEDRPI